MPEKKLKPVAFDKLKKAEAFSGEAEACYNSVPTLHSTAVPVDVSNHFIHFSGCLFCNICVYRHQYMYTFFAILIGMSRFNLKMKTLQIVFFFFNFN